MVYLHYKLKPKESQLFTKQFIKIKRFIYAILAKNP